MMNKIKDWRLFMKTFCEFLRNQVSNIKLLMCKKLFMRSKVTDRLFFSCLYRHYDRSKKS